MRAQPRWTIPKKYSGECSRRTVNWLTCWSQANKGWIFQRPQIAPKWSAILSALSPPAVVRRNHLPRRGARIVSATAYLEHAQARRVPFQITLPHPFRQRTPSAPVRARLSRMMPSAGRSACWLHLGNSETKLSCAFGESSSGARGRRTADKAPSAADEQPNPGASLERIAPGHLGQPVAVRQTPSAEANGTVRCTMLSSRGASGASASVRRSQTVPAH
jgi:hypothetical protein